MSTINDTRWHRRGFTLLWDAQTLADLARPDEAITMREFLNIRQWPDRLNSVHGNAMLVVGLEGCLDMLMPQDAEAWLNEDFRKQVFRFQSEYENQCALILWLPDGRQRVRKTPAADEYLWVCAPPHSDTNISIGRRLWSGAESDARRIIGSRQAPSDPDGFAWLGLYHPRIS